MEKVVVRFEKNEKGITTQIEGGLNEILTGIHLTLDAIAKEAPYTGIELAEIILKGQREMETLKNGFGSIDKLISEGLENGSLSSDPIEGILGVNELLKQAQKKINGGRTDEKSKK